MSAEDGTAAQADAEPPLAGEAGDAEAARVAAAAGTLVHAVLESIDLGAEPTAALSEARRALPEHLRPDLPEALREPVLERADEVLARLSAGPLAARLAEIAPHVIARELDVFLPPRSEDAVGFVSGAIDLLYRDPADAAFVVADYKTDRIEAPAQLAEKAEHYARQGEYYVRAVREALSLEAAPRFELWFLDADEIVPA